MHPQPVNVTTPFPARRRIGLALPVSCAVRRGLARGFSVLLLCGLTVATGKGANTPSLVVMIAVDQMRYDYLERFKDHFEPGGFKLFTERGASFADCHYRHSTTKTAPGHAVMLSGVHADIHGIIANDWIDRESLLRVNSVDDDSVQLLGVVELSGGARRPGLELRWVVLRAIFLATPYLMS
jgi:hypothetical protein